MIWPFSHGTGSLTLWAWAPASTDYLKTKREISTAQAHRNAARLQRVRSDPLPSLIRNANDEDLFSSTSSTSTTRPRPKSSISILCDTNKCTNENNLIQVIKGDQYNYGGKCWCVSSSATYANTFFPIQESALFNGSFRSREPVNGSCLSSPARLAFMVYGSWHYSFSLWSIPGPLLAHVSLLIRMGSSKSVLLLWELYIHALAAQMRMEKATQLLRMWTERCTKRWKMVIEDVGNWGKGWMSSICWISRLRCTLRKESLILYSMYIWLFVTVHLSLASRTYTSYIYLSIFWSKR